MKLPILLASIFLTVLTACAPDTPKTGPAAAPRPEFLKADFSPDADADLKKLGFALPTAKIRAPDFVLKGLDGTPRSLSSFRGKVVLLNFWGVWCYYCRLEMPSLQRLYDTFKARGLEVVAVDVQDTPEEAEAYIKKNKHTFPVLLDESLSVSSAYGVTGFPTTFLVDGNGYLRAMKSGAVNWEKPDVAALFNKILERPAKPESK